MASNQVFALDTESGKLAWKFRVDDWVRFRPVEVDGVIYAVTLNSRLRVASCGRIGTVEV